MNKVWPTEEYPESTWTQPRPDCPHPERWHATDDDSTEVEITGLAAAFVRALRPRLVLETGSAWGQTAEAIGRVLGDGDRLVTFEVDPARASATAARCAGLPVEVRQESSLTGIPTVEGMIGFAWLDSLFELRMQELELVRPLLAPGAVVGIHDAGDPKATKFMPFAREVAEQSERLGFSRISLPTPRGVTFLGWRH